MKRLLLFIFILLPFAIYGQRTDRHIKNNIRPDTIVFQDNSKQWTAYVTPISNFLDWNVGNYYDAYALKSSVGSNAWFYKEQTPANGSNILSINGFLNSSNFFYNNQNIGIGWNSFHSYTSPVSGNVGVGDWSLQNVSAGSSNTALGISSGASITTGGQNLAMGAGSLGQLIGGNYNVSLGSYAGYQNLNGNSNVFIGYNAGYYETGSNKLYIANTWTLTPLIYGDFSTNQLSFAGNVTIPSGSTYNVNSVSINSMVKDTVISNSGVYGECHFLVGSTFTIASPTTNTTYEITGYNGSSQHLRSVTAPTNGLTINSKGFYRISFNCRITTGNINDIGLMVNSSKDNDGGFDTFGYTGNVSGSRILYLNSGDLVKIVLTTDNTTQVAINIKSASLVITKIIN